MDNISETNPKLDITGADVKDAEISCTENDSISEDSPEIISKDGELVEREARMTYDFEAPSEKVKLDNISESNSKLEMTETDVKDAEISCTENDSISEDSPEIISNEGELVEGVTYDLEATPGKVDFADDESQEDSGVSVDVTPEKDGGVLKKMLQEGEGEEYPGFGDRVSVHYTGWLLNKEAVEFDTSRKGERFEFSLGRGQVIKGWDLGISTMKKGEKAVFICHPRYAYGDLGYPPAIPPFTPLIFEIELFEWKMEDLSPKKDESILRKVLEKGEGTTFPNEGAQVKVKFVLLSDNEILEEEMEKDFVLGEGCMEGVPEGLELALFKFHLKEKSLIHLRKKYVPETPEDDSTSDDAEVKYEVTLLDFQKAKEVWEMNSDEKFEKAKVSKEKGVEFFKLGHHKLALKQFKWIVTCLENEPGVSPETQDARKQLLLSGYLNIALCHLKLDNHLDAIKVCNKALVIDPHNEKALFRRGQAKMEINDCEEALSDFQSLCSLKPDNKAAQNYVIVCQNKIKKQNLKDKSTYNKMFEFFVKQDEERLRNMKTETGVWEDDGSEGSSEKIVRSSKGGLNESNSALLDANVIEISNTANISY